MKKEDDDTGDGDCGVAAMTTGEQKRSPGTWIPGRF